MGSRKTPTGGTREKALSLFGCSGHVWDGIGTAVLATSTALRTAYAVPHPGVL